MAAQRTPVSEKLDRLYGRNVRCPYCRTTIPKYSAVCTGCGVHKSQITNASNIAAQELMKARRDARRNKSTADEAMAPGSHPESGKIIMTRRRPDDVSFTKMVLCLLVGVFGVHNFYVGRRVRGWLMLGGMLIYVIGGIIWPMISVTEGYAGGHPWRIAFSDMGLPFPTDVVGIAVALLWIYDCFAVVFGNFKYPVRLGKGAK